MLCMNNLLHRGVVFRITLGTTAYPFKGIFELQKSMDIIPKKTLVIRSRRRRNRRVLTMFSKRLNESLRFASSIDLLSKA